MSFNELPICESCGLPKIGLLGDLQTCTCTPNLMQQAFMQGYNTSRRPYSCPVCGGNGMVANGFYTATTAVYGAKDTSFEPCRSCGGTGVVWG